jgi:DNA mismatch repair protein MSH4
MVSYIQASSFSIYHGSVGYLDVARRTYSETIDDIVELVAQLGEKEELPLKTSYNSSRGFYIQIPIMANGKKGETLNIEDLPQIFIKSVKAKSTINCTTADLVSLLSSCDNHVIIM